MALRLQDKQSIVTQVTDSMQRAVSVVGAHYTGLSSADMTDLRAQARTQSVCIRVVRNTLARRAVEGTPFHCLQSSLVGPMLLAFSYEDPGAPARLLKAFAEDHDSVSLQMFSIDGQVHPAQAIDRLASLPTRDQALARLLCVWQDPMSRCVRVLAAPHTKLLRVLLSICDAKRQATGTES